LFSKKLPRTCDEAVYFMTDKSPGVGQYFVDCMLADIESLAFFHGIHRIQYGCFRMLARRFPFGIYYLETEKETRVVAVLDLRRKPSWLRKEVKRRSE
jgi:hypothetical protein